MFARRFTSGACEGRNACRDLSEAPNRLLRAGEMRTLKRISQPKPGQGSLRPTPKPRHGPIRPAGVDKRCTRGARGVHERCAGRRYRWSAAVHERRAGGRYPWSAAVHERCAGRRYPWSAAVHGRCAGRRYCTSDARAARYRWSAAPRRSHDRPPLTQPRSRRIETPVIFGTIAQSVELRTFNP